jgi:hypothetical protein
MLIGYARVSTDGGRCKTQLKERSAWSPVTPSREGLPLPRLSDGAARTVTPPWSAVYVTQIT